LHFPLELRIHHFVVFFEGLLRFLRILDFLLDSVHAIGQHGHLPEQRSNVCPLGRALPS
jgi:hypothetical protein